MKLLWSPQALQDLQEIVRYISKDSPRAARTVRDRIVQHAAVLREHPALGRPGRVEGTRELVVTSLPYIIPYRVKQRCIELIRVLHTARRWPDQFP